MPGVATPWLLVQAAKLGLVEGVVPREQLLQAARAWAADIAVGAKPRNFSLYRCALLWGDGTLRGCGVRRDTRRVSRSPAAPSETGCRG